MKFDAGPADGAFGPKTRGAIEAWQQAKGYDGTGYLTGEQAEALVAMGEREAARRLELERKAGEEEARRAREERLRAEAEERRRRARSPGTKFRDCPECPELVVVPGGTIGRPFAVGVYEVTFGEWDACVSGGGCGEYRPDDEGWGRGRRPVVNVSWEDAKAYVRWLSRKTGEGYRLLSESEWEYVARAGTRTKYWWGNEIGRNRANCDGCGSRWDSRQTAPVGSFSANGFGLYDVHGNVREWVEDCWDGDCGRRVLRGGSWIFYPRFLRSAYRDRNPPASGTTSTGSALPGRSRLESLHHYLVFGVQGLRPWSIFSGFSPCLSRRRVRDASAPAAVPTWPEADAGCGLGKVNGRGQARVFGEPPS